MQFDLDRLIDALADRVADKVRVRAGCDRGPRLLTVKQAAEYLGRSTNAMWTLIKRGKVPTVRLDNRIFLDIRDLDRVITDCKDVAL